MTLKKKAQFMPVQSIDDRARKILRYKFQAGGNVRGEDLYTAYGRADAGRYLTVFFHL